MLSRNFSQHCQPLGAPALFLSPAWGIWLARFRFPLISPSRVSGDPSPFMKRVRVLLVDDSRVFLRAAQSLLDNVPGFKVVGQATSGEKAIPMVAAVRPDLVLMDIHMQPMNVLETTRRIKRQHDAPKVIIVTLHNEPEYRVLAREAGADGFISKNDLAVELPRLVASLFPPAECLSKSTPDSDSTR